jgi:LysM repeat protein
MTEIPEISRENEQDALHTMADVIRAEAHMGLSNFLSNVLNGKTVTAILPRNQKTGAQEWWHSAYPLRLREKPGKTQEINGIAEWAQMTVLEGPTRKDDKDGEHYWYRVSVNDSSSLRSKGNTDAKIGWVSAEFIQLNGIYDERPTTVPPKPELPKVEKPVNIIPVPPVEVETDDPVSSPVAPVKPEETDDPVSSPVAPVKPEETDDPVSSPVAPVKPEETDDPIPSWYETSDTTTDTAGENDVEITPLPPLWDDDTDTPDSSTKWSEETYEHLTVQAWYTFENIASMFYTTVEELKKLNPGIALTPGIKFKVPTKEYHKKKVEEKNTDTTDIPSTPTPTDETTNVVVPTQLDASEYVWFNEQLASSIPDITKRNEVVEFIKNNPIITATTMTTGVDTDEVSSTVIGEYNEYWLLKNARFENNAIIFDQTQGGKIVSIQLKEHEWNKWLDITIDTAGNWKITISFDTKSE